MASAASGGKRGGLLVWGARIGCAIAVLACYVSAAAAAEPLRWTRTPEDKFQCTKYDVESASPFVLTVPPGKALTFKIAARAGKEKVAYSSPDLPPGATLGASDGRFRWTVAGAAGARRRLTLVATSASGASVSHAIDIVVASDDLRAAWRAGMGTLEPSCQEEIAEWQLGDANGDGRKDVLYRIAYEDYTALRILLAGATGGFTPIDVADGNELNFAVEPGADGKPLVIIQRNCCCIAEMYFYRVGEDSSTLLGEAQTQSCEEGGAFELLHDSQGRVRGFAETGKKKRRVWRLRKGVLTEE